METKKLSDVSASLSTGPKRRENGVVEVDLPFADIEAAIRNTRYGVVQIIIQDGVVVQIDRTEKLRLR